MVKWIKAIVAHIKRENKSQPHPRRMYRPVWTLADFTANIDFNYAAGYLAV